jgi:hypothetical protein
MTVFVGRVDELAARSDVAGIAASADAGAALVVGDPGSGIPESRGGKEVAVRDLFKVQSLTRLRFFSWPRGASSNLAQYMLRECARGRSGGGSRRSVRPELVDVGGAATIARAAGGQLGFSAAAVAPVLLMFSLEDGRAMDIHRRLSTAPKRGFARGDRAFECRWSGDTVSVCPGMEAATG